jgi:hypothetical protein
MRATLATFPTQRCGHEYNTTPPSWLAAGAKHKGAHTSGGSPTSSPQCLANANRRTCRPARPYQQQQQWSAHGRALREQYSGAREGAPEQVEPLSTERRHMQATCALPGMQRLLSCTSMHHSRSSLSMWACMRQSHTAVAGRLLNAPQLASHCNSCGRAAQPVRSCSCRRDLPHLRRWRQMQGAWITIESTPAP